MAYGSNIPRFYAFVALSQFLLWMPVWVVFFERRGLALGQIGLLELLGIGLLALCEVPTGVVADTWGRKWSLALGALLHGVALLGLLTEVLSPVFLLAYALWGIAQTFTSGAADAFVYDSLQADGRAAAYTHVASRQSVVQQISLAASGLLAGFVAARDLRLCFVFTAVACFAAAGMALTFREPPTSGHVHAARPRYRDTLVAGVRLAAGRPRVRYLLLLGAALHLFTTLLTMTAFQPYADEVGLPLWAFGGLLLGVRLSSVGGSALAPRLATWLGRGLPLVLAPAAMAICQLLLWIGASRAAVLLFAVAAAASAVGRPVAAALLNEAIPSGQRATIISLQSLIAMLGLALTQAALLAITERVGAALAVGLSGLLMVALTVPVLVLLRRAPREPVAAVEPRVAMSGTG